jgi:MFS family permease
MCPFPQKPICRRAIRIVAQNTTGFIVTLTVLASGVRLILGGRWTDQFGWCQLILVAQGLDATSLAPSAFMGYSPLLPVVLALSTFFNPMTQPAHTHPFLTGRSAALLSLFPGFDWTLGPADIGVFIDGRGVKIAWPLTFYMGILGTLMLAIPYFRQ